VRRGNGNGTKRRKTKAAYSDRSRPGKYHRIPSGRIPNLHNHGSGRHAEEREAVESWHESLRPESRGAGFNDRAKVDLACCNEDDGLKGGEEGVSVFALCCQQLVFVWASSQYGKRVRRETHSHSIFHRCYAGGFSEPVARAAPRSEKRVMPKRALGSLPVSRPHSGRRGVASLPRCKEGW
jgi:hypothetical protein